jgi:hypothetical protein
MTPVVVSWPLIWWGYQDLNLGPLPYQVPPRPRPRASSQVAMPAVLSGSDRDNPRSTTSSGTRRARRLRSPTAAGTSASWSSSPQSELRITRVSRCVAHVFDSRASFMFAAHCPWRSLAVDGDSGTSRGHAPECVGLSTIGPALLCCLSGDAEPGRDLGPRVPSVPQPDVGLAHGLVQLGGEPRMSARASTSPLATRRA